MGSRTISGTKHGRWTVIRSFRKDGYAMCECRCKCGTVKAIHTSSLRPDGSTSCGCYHREIMTTHGRSSGRQCDPIYKVWSAMIQRSTNPKNAESRNYIDRGITVCKRWRKFVNFLADMGERPSPKHTIDRINNDGNYEPKNCRWATRHEQMRNTRRNRMIVTPRGVMCLRQACETFGLKHTTLWLRLSKGQTGEYAFRPAAKRPKPKS